MPFPARWLGAALFAAILTGSTPAGAEIVQLTSGRTLIVNSHRRDGDQITFGLRRGGELTCPASLVARIDPDEVPLTDSDETAAPPAAAAGGGARIETQARFKARDISGPYGSMIAGAAARHDVDPALVAAVIKAESNYQARARSARGARGLMQLMPDTLHQYQVRNAYDPGANIDAGTRHLRTLLNQFPLAQALAAYNAGVGAVSRHGGIPPFPETQSYVARVLRAFESATPLN